MISSGKGRPAKLLGSCLRASSFREVRKNGRETGGAPPLAQSKTAPHPEGGSGSQSSAPAAIRRGKPADSPSIGEQTMAADRVGRRLGRASPARSTGLSPGGSRAERTASPGIQRRQARVTVKYDRRELQRRLDTEKWIDGRLEELYRGREDEMPDEVNIDDLLEMDTDEERAKKLQGTLESCHNNIEDFTRELLEKLRGLRTEHVLRRTSPSSQRNMEQDPKVPQ